MFFRLLKMLFTLLHTKKKWFFREPKMVHLWHQCETPLLEPLILRVLTG